MAFPFSAEALVCQRENIRIRRGISAGGRFRGIVQAEAAPTSLGQFDRTSGEDQESLLATKRLRLTPDSAACRASVR